MTDRERQSFRIRLFEWYRNHERPLPWKGLDDPYLIWVSEIMLQQTRSDQAWDYFLNFKEAFPTVHDLADASEDEVLAQWKGLGYYARARNLHQAARYVVKERGGTIPDSYEELLELKGVGPYTASAIASFAFNKAHAVLDGNVHRVLSRYMGWELAMDSRARKRQYQQLADELIDPDRPDQFNQAMMDLGAVICTPTQPLCASCPLDENCVAREEKAWDRYPPARKRPSVRSRFFHYLLVTDGSHVALQKRDENDIWKGLYQFPVFESEQNKWLGQEELQQFATSCMQGPASGCFHPQYASFPKTYSQRLSHQKIHAKFYLCLLSNSDLEDLETGAIEGLSSTALPRIIDCFLDDNYIYLINLSI